MDDLQKQVADLKQRLDNYEKSASVPRNLETALRTRLNLDSISSNADNGTTVINLTGIVKANGGSAPTAIVPLAGTKTYYVADSSGGGVTRKLTFSNGVLTAET